MTCAREGGPIATVRDERKIVLVTGGTTQPVVKIFTSSGQTLGAFVWDKGRIAGFAWTEDHDLAIMEVTGEVGPNPTLNAKQLNLTGCCIAGFAWTEDHDLVIVEVTGKLGFQGPNPTVI